MHRSALAAALAVAGLSPLHARAADLAPQCAHLFDSRKAQLLGAHTVIVRDGRIAEVRSGRADVAGAKIIDLTGHTCTPGWTGLHVHLGESRPASAPISSPSPATRCRTSPR